MVRLLGLLVLASIASAAVGRPRLWGTPRRPSQASAFSVPKGGDSLDDAKSAAIKSAAEKVCCIVGGMDAMLQMNDANRLDLAGMVWEILS